MHAIPNGGKRDPMTAARLRAEGVKPGVLDILLPVRRGGYSGFYLEMKNGAKGRLSDEQKEFAAFVETQGYCCGLARSWEEGMRWLVWYLSIE